MKCNCTLAHFFASNQLVTFFRCAHLHSYPIFIKCFNFNYPIFILFSLLTKNCYIYKKLKIYGD